MSQPTEDVLGLLDTVKALEQLLAATSTPHALIGGFAVAFHGRARTTVDIDGIIQLDMDDLRTFIALAGERGFVARVPGDDLVAFAQRNLVIRLMHQPTRVDVDLSLGYTPFEEGAIKNATSVTVEDVTFPLVQVRDLLFMKAVARRPRDQADIEGILDRHPDADLDYVRGWLAQWSEAMGDDTYLSEFERIVRQSRRD